MSDGKCEYCGDPSDGRPLCYDCWQEDATCQAADVAFDLWRDA